MWKNTQIKPRLCYCSADTSLEMIVGVFLLRSLALSKFGSQQQKPLIIGGTGWPE